MLPKTIKGAGDGVVVGGLRCQACGAMYVPSGHYSTEVCALCYLHLCYRERFPRLDYLRARDAR